MDKEYLVTYDLNGMSWYAWFNTEEDVQDFLDREYTDSMMIITEILHIQHAEYITDRIMDEYYNV